MIQDSLFIPRSTIAAFAKSEGVYEVLKALKSHPLLTRAQYEAYHGGIDDLVNHYPTGGTPQLLLLEHDGPIPDLDRVAEISAPHTQLIVLSGNNDIGRYRQLLDRGGSDYLFTPVSPELLVASISRSFARAENRKTASMFAFFGCGGGTGASTVAQNAAVLLSQVPDKKVMLMDFDLHTGSVAMTFGITPVRGVHDLLRDPKSISAQEIARIAHERNAGLQVLCSVPSLEPGFALKVDHFVDILDQARMLVDYVVIDLPGGWSTLHSRLLAMTEHVGLVGLPDLRSFHLLHRIQQLSAKLREGMPPVDLVLNRWTPASEGVISSSLYTDLLRGGRMVQVGEFGPLAIESDAAARTLAEIAPTASALQDFTRYLESKTGTPIVPRTRQTKPLLSRLFGKKAS